MPSDKRYLTDTSKLRTPPRSQADEISDNEKYLLSAECSDHDKDKIKLPEIIHDTPRNPFIGSDIKKNSPIITEHDLALVLSIKPRNILPLLLAESNKKAHNDKDEHTINISIANTTNTTETKGDPDNSSTKPTKKPETKGDSDNSSTKPTKKPETKGDSDNSSTKPTKKSGQTRKKCVTDYGKGTKRNYSKPIAIRKSKRVKR
ncbi:11204_t:CDS:2 [Gigaspora margarita]|uniref:11204_t:CDS:1 n=1 Tax=Gigaspora margarita TaxID=4874 RepID=A0ABN7VHP6_GIGMA|nr:11204_t:CDS:2 [Gigaspora margarita]